ncbi:MAG: hypothetical protein UX00_C0011G0002 [Microgenomates group bacterium GW2011_GWB1_45_17]|nr:MAG: hypothetical protein UX00_C0011G0002 [Microgenomates group bacterium GW2011_GWB1_45_17]
MRRTDIIAYANAKLDKPRCSFKAESSKPNSGVIYFDRFEPSTVSSSIPDFH